ncbi:MAG: hypothetical protein KGH64_04920 [Candidatus Micrarchaeota archaeon]|nr:hypothetical protein [Candidatus Micrarchaeota archaeon]
MAIQSATQPFTVIAPSGTPSILLGPNNGTAGQVYPLVGSNFTYSGPTSDPVTPYFNGMALSCAYGTDYVLGDGTFYCDFTVPNLPPGTYNVTASTPDNKLGTVANQKFTINSASSSTTTSSSTVASSSTTTVASTTTSNSTTTISQGVSIIVTPKSGTAGSTYTVTGTGFIKSSSSSPVYNYFGNSQTLQTPTGGLQCNHSGYALTANASGGFNCTFTVPTESAGTYHVITLDTATNSQANATFMVVRPKITVSPNRGSLKTSYTLTGTGFSAGGNVTLRFLDSQLTDGGIWLNHVSGSDCAAEGEGTIADAFGNFSCTFTIPNSTKYYTPSSGIHNISAHDVNSNKFVSTSLNITGPKITVTSTIPTTTIASTTTIPQQSKDPITQVVDWISNAISKLFGWL